MGIKIEFTRQPGRGDKSPDGYYDRETSTNTWMATPNGQQKVRNYEGIESPLFKVLTAIVEGGTMDEPDIGRNARVPQIMVKSHCRQLYQAGLIKPSGGMSQQGYGQRD